MIVAPHDAPTVAPAPSAAVVGTAVTPLSGYDLVVGDPDAGTRLAGRNHWVLAPGAQIGRGYLTLSDAVRAAEQLSLGAKPAVAIMRGCAGSFAVHAVEAAQGSSTQSSPVLGAFALDSVSGMLSRGGYLGNMPVPQSPLVGLVDDLGSVHLASTGPFGSWGFVPGMPLD